MPYRDPRLQRCAPGVQAAQHCCSECVRIFLCIIHALISTGRRLDGLALCSPCVGNPASQAGWPWSRPQAPYDRGQEHEDLPRLRCPHRGGRRRSAWPLPHRSQGHPEVRQRIPVWRQRSDTSPIASRQITINDLPVGRSVEETIRLIKAFQFTVGPSAASRLAWVTDRRRFASPAGRAR